MLASGNRTLWCSQYLGKHILIYLSDYTLNNCILAQALVARNYLPPFLTFCLHIYFFNRISLFLIISSLFPYCNLFVLILKHSYVNSNLHVSTLYIVIIHKERNSEMFKIVHLLASVTFNGKRHGLNTLA